MELPEGIQGTLGRVPPGMQAEVTPRGAKFEALKPRESLTMELQWPPGLLAPAAYEEDSFLAAHSGVVLGLVLLAGALLYYLLAWVKVGKDPEKGVIIPRDGPPVGYSPGAVRYLQRMKYDETCMAAGLLGLAAKGKVTIRESEGTYTVQKRAKPLERGMPRDKKVVSAQANFSASPKAGPKAFAARHNQRGLLLFADGHVEVKAPADIITGSGKVKTLEEGSSVVWTRDPDDDPN